MVFGQVIQMPCFRESALNGIYSGLGTILITILATSRPQLAANCGLGIFCTVTLGSFAFCRHQREKTQDLIAQAKGK